MSISYTAALVEKTKGQMCDICSNAITAREAESHDFHYSKTKRKTEVFIHKRCWDSLYKSEGKRLDDGVIQGLHHHKEQGSCGKVQK